MSRRGFSGGRPSETGNAGRLLGSPLLVAASVLAVYGASLAAWFHAGHRAGDFVGVGERFLRASSLSRAIQEGPVRATSPAGYDGQTYYYIALDPPLAAPYLDNPGYRYQRIAYPLAARAVVLGRQQLVPEGLLAVNLVAIAGGTLALAAWLRRRRLSPWIAAVWGLHPGQVVSLQRDLADAAGYAVVAVGLWLRDRSAIAASLTFGLAGLTRETTLIFPVLLAGADLLGRRRRRSRCLLELAIAVLPFAAWKLFLTGWLTWSGHAGGSFNPLTEIFSPVPFAGIAYWLPREPGALPVLSAVIVPALICLAAAAWAAWRRLWSAETALLAANVLPVVFAASAVWAWAPSGPRQALGAVLAAILTLTGLPARGWFWLAAGFWLWLAPVWLLRPL